MSLEITYTREQIKKAYLKWGLKSRLNPTDFYTEEEVLKADHEDIAERNTIALNDYIKE